MTNEHNGNSRPNSNPAKLAGQQRKRSGPPLPVLPPLVCRSEARGLEPAAMFSTNKVVALAVALAAVVAIGIFSWSPTDSTAVTQSRNKSQSIDLPVAPTLVSHHQSDGLQTADVAEDSSVKLAGGIHEPAAEQVKPFVPPAKSAVRKILHQVAQLSIEPTTRCSLASEKLLKGNDPENDPLMNLAALNTLAPNTAEAKRTTSSSWPFGDIEQPPAKSPAANTVRPSPAKATPTAPRRLPLVRSDAGSGTRRQQVNVSAGSNTRQQANGGLQTYSKDNNFGTKITWEASLNDAIATSPTTGKLIFLIQISGNFAHEGFT